MQTRLEAIASDIVGNLQGDSELTVGEFDVYVDLTVACSDCGTRAELGQFLRDGGCGCEQS